MAAPGKVKITAKEFAAKYRVSILHSFNTNLSYAYLVKTRGLQLNGCRRWCLPAKLRTSHDILLERLSTKQEEE